MVHTSPSPSPSWQWDPLVRSFPVSSPDLTDLLSGEHVSAVWALSLPPMPALKREALFCRWENFAWVSYGPAWVGTSVVFSMGPGGRAL